MILVAIGANLESDFGLPLQACEEAVRRLDQAGLTVTARSRWYESAPVPLADQPWYVNGVVAVETTRSPEQVLDLLHQIENAMGRVRTVRNAPRVIDLDLLAYGDTVIIPQRDLDFCLPHPRMGDRAFVILPLADIAPDWVHPVSGCSLAALVDALPSDQDIRPILSP